MAAGLVGSCSDGRGSAASFLGAGLVDALEQERTSATLGWLPPQWPQLIIASDPMARLGQWAG
ncbi:MAG: hypothetical protein ACPHDT_10185, partial [Acidimicrobiales bacterium]